MRQLFFLLAVIGTCAPLARGSIVVGANGSGVLSFGTRPSASEWATRTLSGSDVLFANSNDLNNAVQTNATAASIGTQVLDAGGANPPGQNTVAAWSSGGTGGLWTRPTANGATLLMATLMNATGAEQNALRIAYTLGQSGATPAEQVPAHQVYYSFSGELGSWINIPGLSGGAAGLKSNVVAFAAPWTNGVTLYVLWVDDNATGGVDRGYSIDDISFAPTTGLGLEAIPDKVLDVLGVLLFRARVTESNGPGSRFTYSLDPGAPEAARINPTNGLFHWRPTRTDAGTTNVITIRVADASSAALSATQSFVVAVRDYVELTLGSAVLEPGQATNLLFEYASSAPLTNLAFTLLLPTNRLIAPTLGNLAQSVASLTFDIPVPGHASIEFSALPGQALSGTQQLARLFFVTDGVHGSAFLPLPFTNVVAQRSQPGLEPTILLNHGRVVYVNYEPLLESSGTTSARILTLYGHSGTNYLLETSSNLISWQPWQSVTLSNLFQPIDTSTHTNSPIILYRALDGVAAALQPGQTPVEFKAAAKLKKRKIAAALKRQKKLHIHLPSPSPDLIP